MAGVLGFRVLGKLAQWAAVARAEAETSRVSLSAYHLDEIFSEPPVVHRVPEGAALLMSAADAMRTRCAARIAARTRGCFATALTCASTSADSRSTDGGSRSIHSSPGGPSLKLTVKPAGAPDGANHPFIEFRGDVARQAIDVLASDGRRQSYEIDRFRGHNDRLFDLEIRRTMVGRGFFVEVGEDRYEVTERGKKAADLGQYEV